MMQDKPLYLLGISGSLRQQSSNTTLLRAAQKLAPNRVEIMLYGDIALLPHFNPDLEHPLPLSVAKLRSHIQKADGLLFSTPEYAHGIPGSLKNMLDWLVSGSEFMSKPVALLNASSRSSYAQESLKEIVKTMDCSFVEEASTTIDLLGKQYDEAAILANPEMAASLENALNMFIQAIHNKAT